MLKQQDNELPAPLLTFPCNFPLKIIGERTEDFSEKVVKIILKNAPDFDPSTVEMKPSSSGKYLSLGVLVKATSQDMLDELYKDLTSKKFIKFVL
jgi:hypothetical protein